ncbi:recombinase family protein [Coraliomargarita sp. W4R72]
MKIGYARVSTNDQNLDLQLDALKAEGCSRIYQEKISGSKSDRPELNKLKENLRENDTVVVFKIDRLGRSLKHLIETVAEFDNMGAKFKSLQDPIDTTTSQGKLIFNIFASLAEFEREMILERTNAGLQSARARGRIGGRPKGLSEDAENKARICESLYKEGRLTANEIAKNQSISKATLYKYLRHRGVEIGTVTSKR